MANVTTAMLAIDEIDRITDDQWKLRLNERKRKELEFHDRSRSRQFESDTAVAQDTYEKFYGNLKYYIATRRSDEYAKAWIEENARGKIFLDFACGNGENALRAARAGAAFSLGFDISSVSVRNATLRARSEALGNIRFFQADAEDTKLPDSCVDVIVCSGMLHHLDLSYAIPELRRILKPGGRVLVGEALDYNPAIKLYRMLTPEMRTEWEKAHILSLKDVEFASRFLDVSNVRYWHVVGYIAGKFPSLHPILEPVDKLLERIPYIQRMAWIFTFELRKPL
jgi:ubiquinone/menaquinone biosynthesis C-methylase UbiE